MVDLNTIVQNALKVGLAIPAFNIPYLPMLEPVVRAVVDQNSFALIETARLEWIKFEAGSPEAVAREFFRWQNLDHVRLHLDHIPVIDEDDQQVDFLTIIQRAINLGFNSVMVDGSALPFGKNIIATHQAVKIAHMSGIPCEAELGRVFGHKSEPPPAYEELFASGNGFTKLDEAKQFVDETGCDWLSVAIGNIHGAISGSYKDLKKINARLDLDHLEKLFQATGVPLVLHGGSSIPQEYVLSSFKKGIAKINIGTEIRQAYETALKESGKLSSAQDAVYARTKWLIDEYFCLSNSQPLLTREVL